MQLREPGEASPDTPLREVEPRSYQSIPSSPPGFDIEVSPIVTPLRYGKTRSLSYVPECSATYQHTSRRQAKPGLMRLRKILFSVTLTT